MGGRALVRVASVLLTLLLVSCAAPAPPGGGAPWLSGRLSVRVDATADRQANNVAAAFDLRGNDRHGELRLATPLGNVIAEARWDAGGVLLATGQSHRRYADLDTLSREVLGEALPLRAFPEWLSGRPWSGAPSTARADGFDQLGWHVSLARFGEGFLEATRAAPPAVQVRVRLERGG